MERTVAMDMFTQVLLVTSSYKSRKMERYKAYVLPRSVYWTLKEPPAIARLKESDLAVGVVQGEF